ncbi:MAG: hypothetical protein M3R02_22180 [Chloroflexota bacterium]|nr:hypothetical protein [Chloroflexota bacterium]
MMTEQRLDSMQEAATHLLDTLEAGKEVTLEITARDERRPAACCGWSPRSTRWQRHAGSA